VTADEMIAALVEVNGGLLARMQGRGGLTQAEHDRIAHEADTVKWHLDHVPVKDYVPPSS
jgi:hypothetical protein